MRSLPIPVRNIGLCALGLVVSGSIAQANTITLSDQNATFVVDVLDQGVRSMTVDNLNHIWKQDFLHDVTESTFVEKVKGVDTVVTGAVSRQEIGMIDPGITNGIWLQDPAITQEGTNNLTLGYTSEDVAISINFQLVGGELGTNTAKIIETYTITNTNALGPISVNLFAFTDIDLGYDFLDDNGELLGSEPYTGYRQYDGQFQMIATTDSAPDFYKVGLGENASGDTVNEVSTELYDSVDTYFDNLVNTGPGDLQMAAQWVRTLGVGESFSYTHTLQLCPIEGCPSEVPVPAAVWLLGTGFLGLVGVARRRRLIA